MYPACTQTWSAHVGELCRALATNEFDYWLSPPLISDWLVSQCSLTAFQIPVRCGLLGSARSKTAGAQPDAFRPHRPKHLNPAVSRVCSTHHVAPHPTIPPPLSLTFSPHFSLYLYLSLHFTPYIWYSTLSLPLCFAAPSICWAWWLSAVFKFSFLPSLRTQLRPAESLNCTQIWLVYVSLQSKDD